MILLDALGYTIVGGSIILAGYPAFESVFLKDKYQERKSKENLQKAFINADLYKSHGKHKEFPFILNYDKNTKRTTFVFSVPKGLSPDKFKDALFVFKQHFGQFVHLDVNEKRGILKVYNKGLPKQINYNYDNIQKSIQGLKLPIITGKNLEGKVYSFDLVEQPHILIAGETGSGKSSQIRAILTTLIRAKKSEELRFVLGDLKRSEFYLFKNVKHVDGVYHEASELSRALKRVKKEMVKRGNLLDNEGVNNIDKLKDKPPYIVVCIDEVVLLKKEKDIMDILEEISSIGRALGIFLILALQRPDAQVLDGKLKVNLTVRMGFRTADSTNAKIIGTEGAEKISNVGRMILKVNSYTQQIQSPFLDDKQANLILSKYKEDKRPRTLNADDNNYAKVVELLNE
jgi:S-DNA-T family DNA segregation ATPase FtsK/SpoIIIE